LTGGESINISRSPPFEASSSPATLTEYNMAVSVQLVYMGSAVALASVAAVQDIRSRRIANWLTFSGIAFWVVLHLTLGGLGQAALALLAGLAAGGIFLLFWLAGGMGAGDVKLIAAIGCVAGVSSIKEMLLGTVLAGSLLALGLAVSHGRLRVTVRNVVALLEHHGKVGLKAHPLLNVKQQDTLRLPYAVPIFLGCLFAFSTMYFEGGPQ
jgi:prepilin peptidase CpaA